MASTDQETKPARSRRSSSTTTDAGQPGTGTLTDALTRIMAAVGRIEKQGTAPREMGGFRFVRETDVVSALQSQLSAERIMLLPRVTLLDLSREGRTSSGKVILFPVVQLDLYARRGDDELLLATTVGMGQDTSDKGISKAITSAKKQALLIAFMVPTGDDPDAVTTEDNVGDQQRQRQSRQQATRQPQQASERQEAVQAQDAAEGGQRRQVTRADLARQVSELVAQVNRLPAHQQRVVNSHSLRNHVKHEDAGGYDGIGELLQNGTGQQIMAFIRYIQGKLEEASQVAEPSGRAEDMTDDDAMRAGAELAGR